MTVRNLFRNSLLLFPALLALCGCNSDDESSSKSPSGSVSFTAQSISTRGGSSGWNETQVRLGDSPSKATLPASSTSSTTSTTASSGASTRGISVTGTDAPAGSFGVLGYVLPGGTWSSSLTPSFMYNTQVTRQGTSGSYTYQYYPYKYWPDNTSDLVKFFAYYPYNGNGIMLSSSSTAGYPSVTYSPSVNASDQPDLMYASPTASNNRSAGTSVGFSFNHALTRISFSVLSGTTNTVKVQSVSLTGIKSKGTLSFDPSVSSSPWTLSALSTDTSTYKVSTSDGTLIPETSQTLNMNAYQNVTSYSGYLMMLPQSVTAANKVVIKYTIDGVAQVATLSLPATTWSMGQSVTYQMVLSETATISSNCYLVHPSSTAAVSFSFPVSRVNECWGSATYGNNGAYVIGTTDTWVATVIWQDVSGLVTLTKSTGTGPYAAITLQVPAGASPGNAVIGIQKTSGTGIGLNLWSWHIWVTSYDASTNNVAYNGQTWMDRNLGATDNKGTASYGLFYQWGRKDPFQRQGYNAVTHDPGTGNNLTLSIQNPIIFYYAGNASICDWYASSISYQNNNLWSSTKTLYDPCPSGWKVPANGSWSTLTTSNFTSAASTYGFTYTGSPSFFYPYNGNLPYTGNANGGIGNLNVAGLYWSSTYSSSYASFLFFYSDYVYPSYSSEGYRGTGCGVRCVQDK